MSKTKVYIAARYSRRDEAAQIAQRLRDSGYFIVVSTWHDGAKDWEGPPTEEQLQLVAVKDFNEVADDSDMLINLSDTPGGLYQYGSHHVEFGVAYSTGRQCVIIGPRELMFHRLPGVLQFDTMKDFLLAVAQDKGGEDGEEPTVH